MIYRSTVENMPNTHYLVIAGLFFIDIIFLIFVDHGLRKRDKRLKKMEDPKEKVPLEGAKEPEDDFHKKISEKEAEANEEKMAASSITEVIEKIEPKEDKSAA